MRKPELVLLMLFIALIGKTTFAQNSPFKLDGNEHQLVKIDESFSDSTEIKPFNGQGKKIYGLAASAEINFMSDDGIVRLVLIDNNFEEYLLLESSPYFNGTNAVFEGHAEETALLNGITPYAIEVQVKDATINLSHLSYATKGDVISDYNKQKKEKHTAQNKDKIERLNKNLKAKGQHWVAGETSVSAMSYAERKKLYGSSTFPAGFEFYAGGIFSATSSSESESSSTLKSATTSSPYIDSWDWRDRHGKNWISPVTNQGTCGSCWAFASTGATEALVNVFFNQQLNLDLAEQDVLSCSDAGSCSGGYPGYALDYISTTGVVDEVAFPYSQSDLLCTEKSSSPSEQIKIGGKVKFDIYSNTDDDLKQMLIEKGPVSGALSDWAHAMVLVGYKVVREGDQFFYRDLDLQRYWVTIEAGDPLIGKTVWIFKNSWGPYFGDNGYVFVETYSGNFSGTYALNTPITSVINNYEVVCTDNDGDGYYFWGLGPKPANCPDCPDLADGDDSDPTKGPLNEYGYCMPLTAAAPVANFTSTSTTINSGQTVTFTDLTSNTPTSWSWTFEGGTPATSTEQNPTVTYNSTGTFNVSLSVSNAEGTDTKTETAYITVMEPVTITAPTANFSATPAIINEGSEVSFTDLTTNDPTEWSWTFEGGTPATSIVQNPTIVYSTPGTYNVTLTVTNAGGTNTKSITNCIQVIDTIEAPVAAFAANSTVLSEGQSVAFTDQSTNTPTSWNWTFSGGNPASSTEQNPSVEYALPGVYSVTLSVTNDGGSNTITNTDYITVEDTLEAPIADFDADVTAVVEGGEISFTDKSKNTPASWKWVFEGGNPSTSTEKNPKVTYTSPNSYKVSLTVTNPAGNNTKTVENYITVEAAPEPSYCVPTTNASNEWIAEVHIGDNSYISGSEDYADNTTTTFNFTAGSNNSLTLVPGFSGKSSFEYWGIWIDFNSDMNFTEDEKVFTSSKSKLSVSGTIYIPETIITTRMRVAMGSTSPTACDDANSGEVEDYTIVISEPVSLPPVADFTAVSTSIATGQSILFSNLSENEPDSYQWYFPGGTPSESTETNPTVTYASSGTYDVTLIAYKDGFTPSEVTSTNYITVTDNDVTPTPTPSDYCEPALISSTLYYIKDVNIGDALTVSSFGDGYSFDTNPFTLNAGGSYTVNLTPSKTTSRNFWRIWIDFNNDGDFDDADETVLALNNKKGPITASIAIPAYVTETTRIRVAMKVGSAPASCDDDFMGEVEDYLVSFGPQMMQSSMPKASSESMFDMNLTVYPNPTSDWLNLQLSDFSQHATYAIYNTVGEKVSEQPIDALLTTIDMSDKAPGIYLVVVKTEAQTFNKKVIKR